MLLEIHVLSLEKHQGILLQNLLFEDGNFLIYTTMPEWKLDGASLDYYHTEKEVVCGD